MSASAAAPAYVLPPAFIPTQAGGLPPLSPTVSTAAAAAAPLPGLPSSGWPDLNAPPTTTTTAAPQHPAQSLLARLSALGGGAGEGAAPAAASLAAPPATPPYRTISGPPTTPRSLLRTSSLNIKKAAPNRVCCNALLAAYARAIPTQVRACFRCFGGRRGQPLQLRKRSHVASARGLAAWGGREDLT